MSELDVVVIGGGPGGYVAAIRCAQRGLKVACVDDWKDAMGGPALGGTCLNVGCIPSKALLDSSHLYEQMKLGAARHGLMVDGLNIDLGRMHARKNQIVATLGKGIQGLFARIGVTFLHGRAQFIDRDKVEVSLHDGSTSTLAAKSTIIATGSTPVPLPVAPVDQRRVLDSSGALSMEVVPRTLAVIGAGAIGLELGSVWRRLGSKVVVLEAVDTLLPMVDSMVAEEARRAFRRQGLDIRLGVSVSEVEVQDDAVRVRYTAGEQQAEILVDRLIVAVGRRPNCDGLGLDRAGVSCDEQGFIPVDAHYRTGVPGIYAIGDVTRGALLAHRAMSDAERVADVIAAGAASSGELPPVPFVVYTWPEIAWVGSGDRQLAAAGISFRSGGVPFRASGRAHAMGSIEGTARVLAGTDGRLLGVHVCGPHASELVAEAVVAMTAGWSTNALIEAMHAHPTLSEIVREAALAATGAAIHV